MRNAVQTFAFLALLAPPALAQSWPNETGPGGDLFSSSSRQFERFWQAPAEPEFPLARPGLPWPAPQSAAIPMLDWAPPPTPQPAPKPVVRRRTTPARSAAKPAAQSAQPAQSAPTRQEWERSLKDRERELEALRHRLEEERRRFEAQGKAS